MFKLVYRYLHQHLSLLAIVAGALSFFVSNVLMKEILSATLYGQYSVFVTYLSLIYVFGILGTEQVFLRFSKRIKENTIETQKSQLILVFIVVIFSSIVSSWLFKDYFSEIYINPILLFLTSLSMIGTLFVFTILRLNANFVFAQLVSNYWKIIMLILAGFFLIYKKNDLNLFINMVCITIILNFLVNVYHLIKKIDFFYNQDLSDRELLFTAFHFFLAILSFSLIIFADRFIIETKYSLAYFGDFFYLANFFLAPFAILQNYIGFKQLIFFKGKFDKELYVKFNKKVFFLGIILSVFLFSNAFFLNHSTLVKFEFKNHLSVIYLLLLTGIIRLYSSSILSAFEARTSIATLRKANIYIVISTVFILLITFFIVDSIELILIGIIIIWIVRCCIHRQLLLRQLKNNN